ncbi:MAG: cation:proton antiporter, partial [Burkholderiales bacterium]
MAPVGLALQPVLVLLAGAVLAVVACRSLGLPPIIGYLSAGVAMGPHALALVADTDAVRHLAEFGVVFLMFSIGLEFSLPRLRAMGRAVFGLGLSQVAASIAVCVGAALAVGGSWQAGIALGGAVAMSSTAIVSKLLGERLELDTPHGRDVIGVLLFQDLVVVPLLILVPALGSPVGELSLDIAGALAKAAVVLAVLLVAGPRAMRAWLGVVARRRSSELFVLNVLLITLLLAFVTGLAGLSLALGAFLAGMLIAETEFRYQVEEDMRPFRDVLLGLFFVSVGMLLDLRQVLAQAGLVVLLLALLLVLKGSVIALLARAFGAAPGTALRTALALAQGGEFG